MLLLVISVTDMSQLCLSVSDPAAPRSDLLWHFAEILLIFLSVLNSFVVISSSYCPLLFLFFYSFLFLLFILFSLFFFFSALSLFFSDFACLYHFYSFDLWWLISSFCVFTSCFTLWSVCSVIMSSCFLSKHFVNCFYRCYSV